MNSIKKAIAIIFMLVISFLLLCIVIVARKDLEEFEKGLLTLTSMLFRFGSMFALFSF